MSRLFGTDGVRGVANTELTCELALNIGKACAFLLKKNKENVKVIIGNDGRISADMLVSSLTAGLTSQGVDVLNVGIIPTPAISYLVKDYQFDAGIMVTASHNPYQYNGIKIFDSNGYKLPDELEDEIEEYIREKHEYNTDKIGTLLPSMPASIHYADYLLSCLKQEENKKIVEPNFNNLNIAIDCANGASYQTAHYLFSQVNCNFNIINYDPNGTNINDNCGSLHIDKLAKFVKEHHLDAGVAFDGDADRAIFVDELGNVIDGDYILAILGLDRKKKNKLSNNTIVGTVMTNLGFIKFCENNDIKFIATKVGDRYVQEEMNLNNFSLGGEQSGHIIIKDYANTGDGELTALMIFNILSKSGKKFSELANIMKKYPQVLINANVDNDKKNDFYTNDKIKEKIEDISSQLGSSYRVLVRPSGTEPLIRVMIEGEDTNLIEKNAKDLAFIIESELK